MKVQIRDRAALSSLSIVSLRAYLKTREWKDEGPWGSRPAVIYVKEHDGRTWEILLPTRDTIADYAESMAESVAILAEVEARSQIDVFHDLQEAGADVVRLKSENGRSREPLSLRQSAEFLGDAYGMVTAAARSVETTKAHYRGPMTSNVAEYLNEVRALPGYQQGYVLTLHSPVPAGSGTQGDMGDEFLAPFARRVALKLADALDQSSQAIVAYQSVNTDDPMGGFRQAVTSGVSANLCEAVAGLAKKGRGIKIDVQWAPVRPSATNNRQFRFSEQAADILTEAAINFRRDEPLLDESLIAQVVALARDPEEFDGRATVLYIQDGRPFRLQVTFEESSYNTVIFAFQGRNPIRVDGDIFRVGRNYELRNPRNLSLLEVDRQ